jgi:uncharacterized protein
MDKFFEKQPSISPLGDGERMHVLDALRGFALLGILLVNLYYLSGYRYFPRNGFVTVTTDEFGLSLTNLLVQGKFYSLFSFLFGLGFAIQMNRISKTGKRFLPVYLRRLAILFFIGLIHTFIWHGDILTVYALAAILLIPFRNASNTTILSAAVFLLLSPVLLDLVMIKAGFAPGRQLVMWGRMLKSEWSIPSTSVVVVSGDLKTFLLSRIPSTIFRYASLLDGNRFPKLWGMFLIGFYFGRNEFFSDLSANRKLFIRLFVLGTSIGLFFSFIPILYKDLFVWSNEPIKKMSQTLILVLGDHPLALGYLGGFTLLYMNMKINVLNWLAPAGRMALTNYLMQSIIGVFVFYNIGLGLGPVGPTIYLPFAFVVFTVQVLYSRWWLNRFRYGPVEWLWRCGMYGKFQPMMKQGFLH